MKTLFLPLTLVLILPALAAADDTAIGAGDDEAPDVTVQNLRCEYRVNPLGVESAQPELSWILASDARRDVRQRAYQILVASAPDRLRAGNVDLWDSGRVESPLQSARFAGSPLQSAQRIHWTVRVWIQGVDNSVWSTPAEWTMGLLDPLDWKARWIAAATSPDPNASSPMPIFRKEFSISKPVTRALAFVCGLGHFEFSINGARVGDHVFDPGWTDYRDTCLYVPFDVTANLREGDNALGMMLGNGMYNVTGGRYVKFTGTFGEPKLILQIHITYADGSTDTIVSDDTWRTDDGPVRFSCIYGGEDYDARAEQPGWDTPAFDDAAWGAARIVDGPGGRLRASEAPPITVAEVLHPVRSEKKAPGEYLLDMNFNLSARPALRLKGAAGSQVTVRVGELADLPWEGHSYTYTLRGGDEEWMRPRFTYFGFQYLTVSGADLPEDADGTRPVLLEATSEFVTSSAADVGAFQCDNTMFNEIDAMIDRSVRSNLQSVLTDCPHREKLGWLEVSHLMGPSILYHYDAQGLYRKICRDTTEAQLDSGLVPDIAPEYTRFTEGFFESAEWGSASVQLPWLLWTWYGDREILDRQFDTMAKYTRYLASTRNAQGLAKAGLGDWYDWTPEKGHAGYAQLTPLELTATAMLFDNARIVAETARLLGKDDDAAAFTTLAAEVREDFNAAYFDAATASVATGSQAALAVGLAFGLVPDDSRDAVLANLVRAVESAQYKPSTGEVCFPFMIRALADAGRSDVIYRIIDRTDPPGYGCMLKQYGLKTLSEQWDKPGSSLNHCMFGHIQEWFQGHVLGIGQAVGSVGYERLRIAPSFVGELHEASGHFDSPRGRVEVAWTRGEESSRVTITVPGNTTAEVVLPFDSETAIKESGVAMADAVGVSNIVQGAQGVACTVGSGTYTFEGRSKVALVE